MTKYIGMFIGLALFIVGFLLSDYIGYYSLLPIVVGALVCRWFVVDILE